MENKIRILIVDDNPMMRMGLKGSLSCEPGMEVVGEASNGEDALLLVEEFRPDVITMDYQMPGYSGVVTTEKIKAKFPDANVILLSVFDSEEDILGAVRAGVKGYLTKKSGDIQELIDAVLTVSKGETYFPAAIAQKLKVRQEQPDLTARELQILKLLASGNSNKEMASELNISNETVKLHLSNLRDKLGAADRTQAVVLAYKKGILHLE